MNFWNSFGDIIWYFLLVTAFVAYFFALFMVIVDVFRDKSLNGWLKALWILAMIVLPFVAVLVYVIARGRGMGERNAARYQKEYYPTGEDFSKEVISTGGSTTDELRKAKILFDDDVLSQAEYNALKAQILGGSTMGVDGQPVPMNGTPVA